MWVFLTRRLRAWLFFAVAVPLLGVLVGVVRRILEGLSGQTRLTRMLAQIENLGRRKKRGT